MAVTLNALPLSHFFHDNLFKTDQNKLERNGITSVNIEKLDNFNGLLESDKHNLVEFILNKKLDNVDLDVNEMVENMLKDFPDSYVVESDFQDTERQTLSNHLLDKLTDKCNKFIQTSRGGSKKHNRRVSNKSRQRRRKTKKVKRRASNKSMQRRRKTKRK